MAWEQHFSIKYRLETWTNDVARGAGNLRGEVTNVTHRGVISVRFGLEKGIGV